ncbi:2-hydroxychromene-2-carboxylate isomerase [Bradyrhizobium sp. LB7.1]
MPLKVEFQFDFGSPNAYLAEVAIPGIEQRTGVKFEYVPVLLGGIYKATGNMSPFDSLRGIKNKPEYQALETQRFIRRHNITKFRQNSFFPVNTLMLMRGAVAAQFEGVFQPYFRAAYHHMWEEPRKMDDPRNLPACFYLLGHRYRPAARTCAAGRRQEEADRSDQRRREPGGIRFADILRRKGDVLRQGPDPRRRGVDRRTDQATPSQDRLAAPAVRLRRKPSTRIKK